MLRTDGSPYKERQPNTMSLAANYRHLAIGRQQPQFWHIAMPVEEPFGNGQYGPKLIGFSEVTNIMAREKSL